MTSANPTTLESNKSQEGLCTPAPCDLFQYARQLRGCALVSGAL